MPLSLGDKAQRALKLLLGLRNPRVSSMMAVYGFSEADISEGWTLLQALGRGKLSVIAAPPANVEAIQKLDHWENRWFPIAIASLSRRYPAVQARLFLNLSQTEGPEVAVSVRTFLERFDALSDANGPYGPEGPKAKQLLQARGLTGDVVGNARALLNELAKIAPSDSMMSTEELKTDLARAEDALWAWYLEWSQVARTAITQRVLRRRAEHRDARWLCARTVGRVVQELSWAAMSTLVSHGWFGGISAGSCGLAENPAAQR